MTPADTWIGRTLVGTYRLTGRIGTGGMGVVYEADHVRLAKRRFAVKVLHRGADQDPNAYQRFVREAQVTSALGHPNIVYVVDFDTTDDGVPFMVMEHLVGESLFDRLAREGRLPTSEVARIVKQVSAALQVAHDEGVVHRDLKPGNIFLVEQPAFLELGTQAKVLDFGISKIQGANTDMTREGQIIGSAHYLSPEQARPRSGSVDHTTDIFALGIVSYVCLTGERPFDADHLAILVNQICSEHPPAPSEVAPHLPPELDAVIGRALAKSKADRYGRIDQFGVALERALSGVRMLDPIVEAASEVGTAPPTDGKHEHAAPLIPGKGRRPTTGVLPPDSGPQTEGPSESAVPRAYVGEAHNEFPSPRRREPAIGSARAPALRLPETTLSSAVGQRTRGGRFSSKRVVVVAALGVVGLVVALASLVPPSAPATRSRGQPRAASSPTTGPSRGERATLPTSTSSAEHDAAVAIAPPAARLDGGGAPPPDSMELDAAVAADVGADAAIRRPRRRLPGKRRPPKRKPARVEGFFSDESL